jgi:SAM-dependent methyltransferase
MSEQNDIWDEETAKRYDTPGTGVFSPEVLGPTVDLLAELAREGAALEFAIGTGRVAEPLRQRGIAVTGIELSPAMVAQLRTKVDEATIPVVIGDMTTTRVEGSYALVFLLFNSISNLLSQAEQVECFRNAARHLRPGGCFVIELWVPELRKLPMGRDAMVATSEPGHFCVDKYDLLRQQVVSNHFFFGEGRKAILGRSRHRYVWPAELDLMAKIAGFELESRHADWAGADFTAQSYSHVSVYRLPQAMHE